MKVSVIIPTRNGGRYLGRLVETLEAQTFKPAQILVVDSSSDDDTLRICKTSGVRIIQRSAKTFDHGGTRKLAAATVGGDIMVFLTQDALFKDVDCLENLVRPLQDPAIAASYGRQIPKEDANPVEAFVRSFNYPSIELIKSIQDLPRLGVKTFFFSDACSAIKKGPYEEVGGFPDRTIMNEDLFLAAKFIMKGYKIAYQPRAIVYHSHNYPLTKQFRRYFDIGVFFGMNHWIRAVARSEREGFRYLREQIRFLSANGEKKWIPYALADTAVRFLGYRVGLLEGYLPTSFKKRMSLNRGFWESDILSTQDRGSLRC